MASLNYPYPARIAKAGNSLLCLGLLLLVLGGGAFLRLWELNQAGYNSDEAVYAGQAAAIAQDPDLKEIFPVFRAHPLLFQFILALAFQSGTNDLLGRLVSVVIGLGTIGIVYLLGKLLYGPWAGLIAALFLACMPYHVIVSRQVLLDTPLTFFTTLTLYVLAHFARNQHPNWLHAVGAMMGLTFLAKETGIVFLGSIYSFLALSREIPVRVRDIVLATVFMFLVILPFPLSILLGGGKRAGQQYLIWQFFRRPNHEWTFYPTVVPAAIGLLVIGLALLGLWLFRREGSWRERLLLAWIIVPVTFFQLWPTKGFQYLLPIAPAFAVLAGRTLSRWLPVTWTNPEPALSKAEGPALSKVEGNTRTAWAPRLKGAFSLLTTGAVAFSLFIPTWLQIQPATTGKFLAGSGGVPGGREAGDWILEHTPTGSEFMTIGPSMANIIEFYGHRQAYGLSISPNPLRRNPSYQPILNPDLQIRSGNLHYLVWDSFSADRSPFFAEQLQKYVGRYHGRVVHLESITILQPDGSTTTEPVIIIYQVRS